jgi:hypothetical protein
MRKRPGSPKPSNTLRPTGYWQDQGDFMEPSLYTISLSEISPDGEIYLGEIAEGLKKCGITTLNFYLDRLESDNLKYKYVRAKGVKQGDEHALYSSEITDSGGIKIPPELLKKVTLGHEKDVILMCNQDGSDFSIMGKSSFQTFYRSYEIKTHPKGLKETIF